MKDQLRKQAKSTRAMAGLVIMILVMGFMMAISSGNVIIVQNEIQITSANTNPDRAQAAAWSGLMFYMGVLYATETTFLSGPVNRVHFLSETINGRNATASAGQQIATFSPGLAITFPVIATSVWIYASSTAILDTDTYPEVLASSSLFMIKSYVDHRSVASFSRYLYVKSLGAYREFGSDPTVPVASYYSQLIARIEVDTTRSMLTLERVMPMPVECPRAVASPFHSNLYLPWDK